MKHQSSGFTLIELLIVLVILGTLAALAYPSYVNIMKDSSLKAAKTNILQTEQHFQRYYMQNGYYKNADKSVSVPANLAHTDKFDVQIAKNVSYCNIADGVNSNHFCLTARPNDSWKNTENRFLLRDELGEIYTCTSNTSCEKN